MIATARRVAAWVLFRAAVVGSAMWLGVTVLPAPAPAQSLNFGSTGSDQPIEIFADEGIEWQQENKVFVARGKARAVRGELEIFADVLRAYYREMAGGGTEIWRLDVEGNVRIVSPDETAYGENGYYDVDNAVLVLIGKNVKLVAGDDVITADQQLEYWEKKQLVVARGNAVAVRGDRRLSAQVLAAYLKKDEKDGATSIHRVEAFDDVRVVTAEETATSDRGVYNVESGIATLMGSVRIVRGGNRLDGCRAEINLETGISKLFSCGKGKADGKRARGLLQPGNIKKK